MDKDFILNTWIPALRSGTYDQGRHKLKDDQDRFCCLGLACHLIDPKWKQLSRLPEYFYWIGTTNDTHLPYKIADRLFGNGDINCGPEVEIDGIVTNLAGHNDRGVTFSQIADALEAWVAQQDT